MDKGKRGGTAASTYRVVRIQVGEEWRKWDSGCLCFSPFSHLGNSPLTGFKMSGLSKFSGYELLSYKVSYITLFNVSKMHWAFYWKGAKFSSMSLPCPPNAKWSGFHLSVCICIPLNLPIYLQCSHDGLSATNQTRPGLFYVHSASGAVLTWLQCNSNAISSVGASMVRHLSSSEETSPPFLLPLHMLGFPFCAHKPFCLTSQLIPTYSSVACKLL